MNSRLIDHKIRLKDYRLTIIVISFFLIGIMITCSYVFLNGDDYMWACYSKRGIFSSVGNYYMEGNGRFWLNVMTSTLLSFDRYLYIVICPIVVLAFLLLISKYTLAINEGGQFDKHEGSSFLICALVLFCCVGVMCLRETLYWITGMMNYLFCSVMFLLGMLCYHRLISKEYNRPVYRLLYFLIFILTSSVTEQYGLMFAGYIVILIFFKLINKQQVNKTEIAACVISFLALSTVIVAPGNWVKYQDESSLNVPFELNLEWLLDKDFSSDVAFPFVIMLSIAMSVLSISKCKVSQRMYLNLFPLFIFIIKACQEPLLLGSVFCSASIICILIVQSIVVSRICRFKLRPEIMALIIIGIGSQVMLLVSVIWGYRCMFSLYTIYMVLIMYMFTKMERNLIYSILACGAVSVVSPLLMIPVILLVLLFRNDVRTRQYVLTVVIAAAIIFNMGTNALGYIRNSKYCKNTLESVSSYGESQTVTIYVVEDLTYSWEHFPLRPLHDYCFREYYGIPDTVEIDYV